MRQVETEHMQLHCGAADYGDAFAKIDMSMARRMDERNKHHARA